MKHGSYSTYTNHRCRCGPCRAAHAAWQREYRKRLNERLVTADVPHGTFSTYTNWGCRCSECTAASRRQWEAFYLRKARELQEQM